MTEHGRAQAAALARHLANCRFDRIYSSNLRRALETALAIAQKHGLQPVTDGRLREFSFGAWEGLTWAEILAARPEMGEMDYRAAHRYAPVGGEDFSAVCARVGPFYDDVLASGLQRIAVVTHAGVLHATLGLFELAPAADEPRVNFSPASITRVVREHGAWRLIEGPTALQ